MRGSKTQKIAHSSTRIRRVCRREAAMRPLIDEDTARANKDCTNGDSLPMIKFNFILFLEQNSQLFHGVPNIQGDVDYFYKSIYMFLSSNFYEKNNNNSSLKKKNCDLKMSMNLLNMTIQKIFLKYKFFELLSCQKKFKFEFYMQGHVYFHMQENVTLISPK